VVPLRSYEVLLILQLALLQRFSANRMPAL
jgi:hypothetical protein